MPQSFRDNDGDWMNTAVRGAAGQAARTRLTQGQEEVLRVVSLREHVSISETAERVRDVQVLLSGGYLRLATVVYPWGLDFELEPAHDRGSPNRGPKA